MRFISRQIKKLWKRPLSCKDIAMQNLKMGVRIASTTSEVMKVVVFLTNFRVIISYQIEL
nr:MAG TPA: hypothetical protein [Caudoviricetes sp.]